MSPLGSAEGQIATHVILIVTDELGGVLYSLRRTDLSREV